MLLEELSKNETLYIDKCKKKAEKYFIDFFGKEYNQIIKNKLSNVSLFFVDRKKTDYIVTKESLTYEKEEILIDWFKKCFPHLIDENEDYDAIILQNIEDIFNNITSDNVLPNYIEEKLSNVVMNKVYVSQNDIKNMIDFSKSIKNEIYLINKTLKEQLININNENDYRPYEVVAFDSVVKDSVLYNTINKKDFEDDLIHFIQTKNSSAFCGNHITANPGGLQSNINCFFTSCYGLQTVTFFHELLHAISISVSEGQNEVICFTGIEKKAFKDKNYFTKYKFLNEVLTDYFAYSLTAKSVFKNDTILFNHLPDSFYSYAFKLCKPLIKKYFKTWKYIYVNNSIEYMENLFGEENLLKLDQLLFSFSSDESFNHNSLENFDYEVLVNLANDTNYLNNNPEQYNSLKYFKEMDLLTKKIELNIKQKENESCF